ncbi:CLUMA_CG018312, isoform A [Clunio marinus]|uniref:CLUMA_CG018312, isoform A n=1 Tax=Clunio marinus TaxID=568069 RepID=A0A1J1J2T6_9DIPT|nr:CLUMA_CG018312, isoform A [Clunio marinus]
MGKDETKEQRNNTLRSANNEVSLTDIGRSLSAINETLAKMKTGQEKLSDDIKQVRGDIKKSSDEIKMIADGLKNLKTTMHDTIANVSRIERKLEDALEIDKRINNLRLDGLSYQADEKLDHIMQNLLSRLGYANSGPRFKAYRLKSQDNSQGSVIIKFATAFDKNIVYERYLKLTKYITVGLLTGSSDQKRCFLSHDLSRNQYAINKAAVAAKKEGRIHKIRTVNGCVLVKISPQGEFRCFDTPEMLKEEISE